MREKKIWVGLIGIILLFIIANPPLKKHSNALETEIMSFFLADKEKNYELTKKIANKLNYCYVYAYRLVFSYSYCDEYPNDILTWGALGIVIWNRNLPEIFSNENNKQ